MSDAIFWVEHQYQIKISENEWEKTTRYDLVG
jgi:hypothetical protein